MRYLGIDYGLRRVGVAVSDPMGVFAVPVNVFAQDDRLIDTIAELCTEYDIGEIVIGDSRDFSQKENEIMKQVKIFIESLSKKVPLPVHLHPEFMTSIEAERLQGKNNMHDASAAALILRHFLETKHAQT